ncbi:MAG TPA: SCO family protein [Fimbriimonadaceae bacterium]|nr:SCO family protein [Fimbriimonadaceae bacterium]
MRSLTRLTLGAVLLAASVVASAQFYGDEKSVREPGTGRVAVKAAPSQIGVDQKLNDTVPMDVYFTDSSGNKVTMRDLVQGRPVILMPVFYECPGVCTMELDNMVQTLHSIQDKSVGKDFDVVTFSIKPTETVKEARDRKNLILDIYHRKGAEEHWHFLVGNIDQIKKLTKAIGFRFNYDPTTDQVVHPAAAVVLTPDGQISKYFLDLQYPADQLLAALQDASKGRVGVKAQDDSFWNCICLDPVTGQRSLNVLKILKLAGYFTLLAVVGSITFMLVKYKATNATDNGPTGGAGE